MFAVVIFFHHTFYLQLLFKALSFIHLQLLHVGANLCFNLLAGFSGEMRQIYTLIT